MDDFQDRFQPFGRDLFAQRKGDVVGHRFQIAAQIAVFVDASHQIDRQPHLLFREVAVAELFDQVLLQRTAARQGNLTGLVVFRIVVGPHLVGRRVVFAQVFVDRYLLGFLLLVLLFGLFEHDVLLDLLLDALFELHGRQFEQFNHLDLLRGELLLKRHHLFLMNSHGSIKLKSMHTRKGTAAHPPHTPYTRFSVGEPLRLKFGVLRGAGERYHVADIAHARNEEEQTLEAESETGVGEPIPSGGCRGTTTTRVRSCSTP